MSTTSYHLSIQVIDTKTQLGLSGVEVHLIGSALIYKKRIFRSARVDSKGIANVEFTDLDLIKYYDLNHPDQNIPPFYFQIFLNDSIIYETPQSLLWQPPITGGTVGQEITIPLDQNDTQFRVSGKILQADGTAPAKIYTVKAFHCGVIDEIELGNTVTNAGGFYSIAYPRSLLPGGLRRANLTVRLFATAAREAIQSSPLILDANIEEKIDLAVETERYAGRSEYQQVREKILPHLTLDRASLAKLQEKSILLLAKLTRLPQLQLSYFIKAQQVALSNQVSDTLCYALFRMGAPMAINELLGEDAQTHQRRLQAAVKQNVIEEQAESAIDAFLRQLQQLSITTELSVVEKPEGNTRDVLNLSTLTDAQKQRFLQLHIENNASMPDLWDKVRTDTTLGQTASDELQGLIQFGLLTLNHAPLIQKLTRQVPSARATAGLTKTEWQSLTATIDPPADIEGETVAEKKKNYLAILDSLAAQAYPTTRLLSRWTQDIEVNKPDLSVFFNNNANLELSHTSVRQYLDNNPTALNGTVNVDETTQDLKTLERLFRLVPEDDKFDTTKALYQRNIHSSQQITQLGESEFIRVMDTSLGQEQAEKIYARASQRTAMAMNVVTNFHPNFYFFNPAVIGSLVFEQTPPQLPNWSTLFGSLDYCDCIHCRSVLSPAAYFVDSLQFLQNASAGTRAALTELLSRRPDLGQILLNCKNTNTTLPYIDLVNEVLENAVVNGPFNLATSPAFQTEATDEQLQAMPEHILPAAYQKLSTETFPWSLPFNLWHIERENYLQQMNISVAELMDVFHQQGQSPSAIDRAAVYLGMTQVERQLITNAQANHNLTTSNAVLTIMRRSQTSFEQLQELLTSQYINPSAKEITFADESCALENAELAITAAERRRMYRFRKLQLIADFSVPALDHIIEALPFSTISDDFLIQLAACRRLQKHFNLPIPELLSWWGSISVRGHDKGTSLYQRLFLNATINNPVISAFQLNADHTELSTVQNLLDINGELDDELTAVLLGSLNITAEALRLIIDKALPTPVLNYENLSQLYRIASFSRALGVDIHNFFSLTRLLEKFGIKRLVPAETSATLPSDTWEFVEQYRRLQAQGVDIVELDWLLGHHFTPDFSTPLDEQNIALLLDEWQRELRKLYFGAAPVQVQLEDYLAEKLPLIVTDSETALAIIRSESSLSEPDQLSYIETNLNDVLHAAQLVGTQQIVNLHDRLQYAYTRVAGFLAKNMIFQQLSSSLAVDVSTSERLLGEYLRHPDNTEIAAIDVFLSAAFIYNDNSTQATASYASAYQVMHRLVKIVFALNRLHVPATEVDPLLTQSSFYGWYDLSTLPVAEKDDNLQLHLWMHLVDGYQLNQSLFKGELTTLNLLEKIRTAELDQAGLLTRLSEQSGWEKKSLEFLTGANGYNWQFPADFHSETWLLTLQSAFKLLAKSGTTAVHMWQWNQPEASEALARQIKNAVKSHYSNKQWLDVATQINDILRMRRRDALKDFLLATNSQFRDSDDLYTHLLIDIQMQSCFLTSRIKQAISSVQLFVQRVLMGLEPSVLLDAQEGKEWQWRKNYRVWEAGRKVFLFPENFAQAELLDDKSPLMLELEEALLQEEVNAASVERAYLRYLRGLDEVARLDIAGMYNEETQKVLHIFARTAATPAIYYYRKWVDESFFTPWEKVPVSIEGNHLIPVVYNRRLHLLWPTFVEKTLEPSQSQLANAETSKPRKYYHIYLNWSELQDGKWISPKKSTQYLSTLSGEDFEHGYRGRYYFWANAKTTRLEVYPFFHHPVKQKVGLYEAGVGSYLTKPHEPVQMRQYFAFQGCGVEPLVYKRGSGSYHLLEEIPYRVPRSSFNTYMKFRQSDNLSMLSKIKVDDSGQLVEAGSKVEVPLTDAPNNFYITPPHQYLYFVSNAPFFYEDEKRTFIVIPEKVYDSGSAGGFEGNKLGKASPLNPSTGPNIRGLLDAEINFGALTAIRDTYTFSPVGSASAQQVVAKTGNNQVYTAMEANQVIYHTDISTSPIDEEQAQELGDTLAIYSAIEMGSVVRAQNFEGNPSNFSVKTGYHFRTFYHPYTCHFIEQVNQHGVSGLLQPKKKGKSLELYRQLTPNSAFKFSAEYGPNSPIPFRSPVEDIDFTYEGAYSQYNWELFFHIPMMLAERLSQNQKFADAQKWYHYIFDPTETDNEDLAANETYRKFWKIKPFYEFSAESTLQELMDLINKGDAAYEKQIARWEADPFNPHLLARLRIVAYMKHVVMKYLDNLIAWADHLFRQDSIESINEATHLYILAGEILGRKPVEVPSTAADDRDFGELQQSLDAFSNALVRLENEIMASPFNQFNTYSILSKKVYQAEAQPAINQPYHTLAQQGSKALATMFSYKAATPANNPNNDNPLMLYFCLPHNEKMLNYWDNIADRLFKIRNCQNIDGVTRSLALFQPPIDPALLVKAAAAGVDLSSALNDLHAPLPHYRFSHMLQKANELTTDIKALGNALLSALEKRDAEALAVIRAGHEVSTLKSLVSIKLGAIEEAKASISALEKSRDTVEVRHKYYSTREYTNANEKKHLSKLQDAFEWQVHAQGYDLAANFSFLFPDAKVGIQGVASPEATFSYGGSFFGRFFQTFGTLFRMLSSISSHQGNRASIKGGYDRRRDDWELQTAVAEKELVQIDKQIVTAKIRLSMAEKELNNQHQQIEQSESLAAFMVEKYTNKQLYSWLIGQIAGLYFQGYQMAYDLAKRAERCMRYELGLAQSNFVQFGYWDSLKKGLLSGEKLQKDLRRMEIAYMEQNQREFELTKHVSLTLLNPLALLQLKESGKCHIELPETIFDLDYPGHYFRRIKSVGITIPTVIGPYSTLSCTLRLLRSSIRRQSTLLNDQYARDLINDDPRFSDSVGEIQSIATSSGQNDAGLFELNFRDERYLPFEGAGAISRWQLEMPDEFRSFDYDSISDVILHLNYTAREGGDTLKNGAHQQMRDEINALVTGDEAPGMHQSFSTRHIFPDELHRFLYPANPPGQQILALNMGQNRFPFMFKEETINVEAAHIFVQLKGDFIHADRVGTSFTLTHPGGQAVLDFNAATAVGDLYQITLEGLTSHPGEWALAVTNVGVELAGQGNQLNPNAIENITFILRYKLSVATPL